MVLVVGLLWASAGGVAEAIEWDAEGHAVAQILRQINPDLTQAQSAEAGLSFEKWYRRYHLESRPRAIAMIHLESRAVPEVIGDDGKSFGICQVNWKRHGRHYKVSRRELLEIDRNLEIGLYLWKLAHEKYSTGPGSYNPPPWDKGKQQWEPKYQDRYNERLAIVEAMIRDVDNKKN